MALSVEYMHLDKKERERKETEERGRRGSGGVEENKRYIEKERRENGQW